MFNVHVLSIWPSRDADYDFNLACSHLHLHLQGASGRIFFIADKWRYGDIMIIVVLAITSDESMREFEV